MKLLLWNWTLITLYTAYIEINLQHCLETITVIMGLNMIFSIVGFVGSEFSCPVSVYFIFSATDPSVYFIHEIGILEIRFEFWNWFVKEYFWWMICVAVTVGCWISAGWLKSFRNMNPTINRIMQFPAVNGKYLINNDLASQPWVYVFPWILILQV